MNYNEALTRNALLNELGAAKGLKSKAMTEKILLGLHYRKAAEEWMKVREAVEAEKDATEEVRTEAISKKAAEDCGMEERRMSREAFEQVVEAMMPIGAMPSFLLMRSEGETEMPQVPVEVWLNAFAEVMVEC